MLLIQLTVVLPLLPLLVNAQNETTYPDCCAALRTQGLSVCDYDFLGSVVATTSETECICRIDDINTPLNQCIACMRRSPEIAAYADGYADICKNYKNATVSALGDNSTSTTITNSAISTGPTTTDQATKTLTSTTAALPTTTQVAIASAVDNGNNAIGGNTPSLLLAALLLLVQVGL